MSTTDLPGSSLLASRYRLVERLGAGGMSVVWRGFDEVLGRQVAVKVLPPSTSTDPSFRRRLRAEAQAAARLSHPHITNVYDYGEATTVDGEPVPYVVMELIDGESLAAVLARVRRLPWQAAVRIAAEVAAALAAAHARGIVHRDVTPANVMLTASGSKVVDFGISALIGENDIDPDGSLLGTPAYLAPERLEGGQVSPATDVYAVGLLIYRTLIGQLPWDVGTTTALLRAHQYVEPDPLPPVEGLPDAVAALVGRCLEKRPSDRPSSAELAQILAGVSAGAPVVGRGYSGEDWSGDDAENTTILPSPWPAADGGRFLGREPSLPTSGVAAVPPSSLFPPPAPRPGAVAAAEAALAALAPPLPAGPQAAESESGPLAGAAARNSRFASLRGGPVLNTPPAASTGPALRPASAGAPEAPGGNAKPGRFQRKAARRVIVVAAAVVLLTTVTYAWGLTTGSGRDKEAAKATPLPAVVAPTGKCVVSYAVWSDADGKFSAQVTLANRADIAVKNWKLWFLMPGDQVVSGNGKVPLIQAGPAVTVTSGASLPPQKTLTMPITGRYKLNNAAPLAFELNGQTCETFVSAKPGEPSRVVEHLSDGGVRLGSAPTSSTPAPGVSIDPAGVVHITPTTAPTSPRPGGSSSTSSGPDGNGGGGDPSSASPSNSTNSHQVVDPNPPSSQAPSSSTPSSSPTTGSTPPGGISNPCDPVGDQDCTASGE